jgi:hypothetical protein
VKARVTGRYDPHVTVAWCFAGKALDGGAVYVYDSGSREALIGGTLADIGIIAKPIMGEDTKYNALHQRERSGGRPYGYAVRITQRGRVVASMESSVGLLALIP